MAREEAVRRRALFTWSRLRRSQPSAPGTCPPQAAAWTEAASRARAARARATSSAPEAAAPRPPPSPPPSPPSPEPGACLESEVPREVPGLGLEQTRDFLALDALIAELGPTLSRLRLSGSPRHLLASELAAAMASHIPNGAAPRAARPPFSIVGATVTPRVVLASGPLLVVELEITEVELPAAAEQLDAMEAWMDSGSLEAVFRRDEPEGRASFLERVRQQNGSLNRRGCLLPRTPSL